jgi:acyl-CoA thioesterase-1
MPVTVQSIDGGPSPVVYELPQVVGGETPVRVSCSPVSNSVFQLGTTTITCTVSDAVGRTDACTFTATVTLPPQLAVTSFLAFGNSITEGKTATGVTPDNYVANLEAMLDGRYTAQAGEIEVLNRGLGGETAAQGAARLPGELIAFRPAVLLLEEGVNDLSSGAPAVIAPMIAALRDMVREAKARNVHVFLGTLLPVREGSPRTNAFPIVVEANKQIRNLAAEEGVTLVDLYAGFGGSPEPFIDTDGLHPNLAGHQKMAELFFDAIRNAFETGRSPAPMFQVVRGFRDRGVD